MQTPRIRWIGRRCGSRKCTFVPCYGTCKEQRLIHPDKVSACSWIMDWSKSTFNGLINIGIIEDNKGRIAACFNRNSAELFINKHKVGHRSAYFLMVEAAILYSSLATGVDPVKETFFTVGFSHISFATSLMFFCVVTMLITPSGMPALLPSCAICV